MPNDSVQRHTIVLSVIVLGPKTVDTWRSQNQMHEALMLWDLLVFNTMTTKLYEAILYVRFPIVREIIGSIMLDKRFLAAHTITVSAVNAETHFNVPERHRIFCRIVEIDNANSLGKWLP